MIYAFTRESIAEWEIDLRVFELRCNGQLRPIEPQVYDLLVYLIEHRERVVPKQELHERLWSNRVVCDATVSHCVMSARRVLGDNGQDQSVIKTYHRRGYRFIADVDVRTLGRRQSSIYLSSGDAPSTSNR